MIFVTVVNLTGINAVNHSDEVCKCVVLTVNS